MNRAPSTTRLLLSALATGGFVKHTHTPFTECGFTRGALPDAAASFDYPVVPIAYKNRMLSKLESADHVVRYVRFPSAGLTRQPDGLVHARYWQGKSTVPAPLVIVLPIFGSYTYPTEVMVRALRHRYGRDCHVLQILGEEYLLDWQGLGAVASKEALLAKADEMAELMRVAVIDLRRCVDWALDRPEVDGERIGLIGFSMGAFLTALALGVEDRFRAGVVIMGGAGPADIIARCGGQPGRAKRALMERLGMGWRTYHAILKAATRDNDPARFAGRFCSDRIMLVDALYDSCMPASSREALWESMGRPERYTMHYGHKSAFLGMTPLGRNFIRIRTLRFLDRVL